MIQSVWKTGFNQFLLDLFIKKRRSKLKFKTNDHQMQYEFRKMFKLWFFFLSIILQISFGWSCVIPKEKNLSLSITTNYVTSEFSKIEQFHWSTAPANAAASTSALWNKCDITNLGHKIKFDKAIMAIISKKVLVYAFLKFWIIISKDIFF